MATDEPTAEFSEVETVEALDTVAGPIFYQDTVRFKTKDGKYLLLAAASDESNWNRWVTLADEPTDDCNFVIRNWDYDDTDGLRFSGNTDADTPDCRGNFRLIPKYAQPPDGDTYCLSMAMYEPNVNLAYWGVSWGAAYDLETFCLFATVWPSSDGYVNSGDPVKIRNMIGAKKPPPVGGIGQFLTVGQINGDTRVIGSYHTYEPGHEFVIEKVA